MKKIIAFVLVALLLVSAIPTVLATNDYTQGTQVVYTATGSEAYTITVPALLSPGASGTVTLSGTWADNRIVTVTAEPTVTLTNSIKAQDQKVLNVHFDGISEAGSNIGTQTFTESVSVDNITNALFGTWRGKFNYNVDIADAPATLGCDTLCWPGDTDGLITINIDGASDTRWYRVSDVVPSYEDLANGVIIVMNYDGEYETYEFYDYDCIDKSDEGFIDIGEGGIIIVPYDNCNVYGSIAPKAGVYFAYNHELNYYCPSMTINGYTEFEHFDGCPHDDNSGNVGEEEETPSAVGCDTLYWDGNTDGHVNVLTVYKVSDIIITKADIRNGVRVGGVGADGTEFYMDIPQEEIDSLFREDGLGELGGAVVVPYDNYIYDEAITIQESGIYFHSADDGTILSFTIPGYTRFPHSDKCGH